MESEDKGAENDDNDENGENDGSDYLPPQLESEDKGAENGLILMNHHTELDWLYSWMVRTQL